MRSGTNIFFKKSKKKEYWLLFAKITVSLWVINNCKDDNVMTTGNMIRFICILLLWVGLCWLLLTRAARIDFMVIFTIVASGIIVFVPLYKKYVRRKSDK
jgi:hypothetical protein